MTYRPRNPYAGQIGAARYVADRIIAAIAFRGLRGRLLEHYPACTEILVRLHEREPDHFVFTEIQARDAHGTILGEPRFLDHVIVEPRPSAATPDPEESSSDADTIRLLGSRVDDGVYVLDLTQEPGGLGVPDLLEPMPPALRRELASAVALYATADEASASPLPGA